MACSSGQTSANVLVHISAFDCANPDACNYIGVVSSVDTNGSIRCASNSLPTASLIITFHLRIPRRICTKHAGLESSLQDNQYLVVKKKLRPFQML